MSALLPPGERPTMEELREIWRLLSLEERAAGLELLPREDADELFFSLRADEQAGVLGRLTPMQEKSFIRLLAPDDVADLVQAAGDDRQAHLLALLDDRTRAEVIALLRYEEDDAGGLMNPRYVRLRPEITAEEALFYLRRQARDTAETIYVAYVLDAGQHLLGAVSLREVLQAEPHTRIAEIMSQRIVSVREHAPQDEVSRVFADHDLNVVPVLDDHGIMKGIVTVDDIVDVVREEATEDIQRMGGVESLERPYAQISLRRLLHKRIGWLAALFVGEMFTTTAMAHYQSELDRATILAQFIPLIASAGGNSGGQSTALIVRALAVGELKLRDWAFVLRRELAAGLGLGTALGGIGWLRVLLWGNVFHTYGAHFPSLAMTIGVAVVLVVFWGTLTGAMLPFLILRCGLDPAVASAPAVATVVDVVALVIYFQVARALLGGLML